MKHKLQPLGCGWLDIIVLSQNHGYVKRLRTTLDRIYTFYYNEEDVRNSREDASYPERIACEVIHNRPAHRTRAIKEKRLMHKKWYLVLAILIILLLDTACILFLLDKYVPQETFNLFEAFFRFSMSGNNDSPSVQDAETYFLEIEGRDPPSEFMVRFAKHSPLVKKGSEFVADDFDNNMWHFFRIERWRWIGYGWDHAVISGGYDVPGSASRCGGGAVYIFRRGKKGWAFDKLMEASYIGIEIPIPPSL